MKFLIVSPFLGIPEIAAFFATSIALLRTKLSIKPALPILSILLPGTHFSPRLLYQLTGLVDLCIKKIILILASPISTGTALPPVNERRVCGIVPAAGPSPIINTSTAF
jgi:hypothetical protein